MNNHNPFLHRLDQEFRAKLVRAKTELGLTEEEIADALHADRSLVNMMVSYSGSVKFPASYVNALNTSAKAKALRLAIVSMIAEGTEIEVTKNVLYLRINGTIDDEIASMVEEMGAVRVQLVKDPARKVAIAEHIMKMRQLVNQIQQEVNSKVS